MKGRIAALAVAAAGLLGVSPAWSLTATLDLKQGAIGVPQTFKVSVPDAVGAVSFRWNFGDGSDALISTEASATHTYAAVGQFNVFVNVSDDVERTSAQEIFNAHYPLTPIAPTRSGTIVFDEKRNRIWNVNPDSGSVSVVDAQALTRIREVPVGQQPGSLAVAPDGTIWVTNRLSDEVVVLDGDSGEVVTRIPMAYASQPHSVAFGPSGKAYVTLYATGKLVEIDAASRMVGRELLLGPTAAGVSVAADGRIFVTRFISPADHGEVWVVAPASLTLANTIPLAFDQTPDSQSGGRGVPNFVSAMVISPDGTQGWVSGKKDDTARGVQRDGQHSTSDNFVRSAVCAIDLASETEVLAKRQDIDNRSTPVSTAFSHDGDYALVLVQPDNWIGINNAYTGTGISGIREVGLAPDGLVLLPNGKVFVSSYLTREVIVYDVNDSIHSIDHAAPPPLAKIRTIDTEPLPADVLRGKQVFFNAFDTRMGHAGYWACASCHIGGISDGRVWDFTDRGEGLRNTKTLLGVRGTGQGRVHWSGNMDEIQDFERDIRDSFEGSGFMADADYTSRKDANGVFETFGPPTAGLSQDLDALAAYFATFEQVPRSPFRNPDGSFTKDALLGRKVYEKAACPACHSGPDFTDSTMDTGLHDVGTILPTSGSRLGGPLTGIDTPTLKGLWQSAPYLHDGRAQTLLEIFTTYTKDNMGIVSNLSEVELNQMVRYLQELDDVPETVVPDVPMDPMSNPSSRACSVGRAPGAAGPGAWGWLVAALLAVAVQVAHANNAKPPQASTPGAP